jgi:hypothetical protein
MKRAIVAFHTDEEGDWIAELASLHAQHVHHRPPIWPAPWVDDEVGRAAHVGSAARLSAM